MSKPGYKLVEKNTDPLKAVIEKSGITVEFTLEDMLDEQKQLRKVLDEYKAQRSFESAKMENIEHFHPFVLDFDDNQRNTIAMYNEAKLRKEAADVRIAEYSKQLQESEKEMALISEKLKLRTSATAVAEAVARITENG